jgi:hypothetical protein
LPDFLEALLFFEEEDDFFEPLAFLVAFFIE